MDKYWTYLAISLIASLHLQAQATISLDAVAKFEEELALIIAELDAPLAPPESRKLEPIIGDYFLITEKGIEKVTQLPMVQEQVHTITLDSGVKIYYWKPKDTV